MFRPVVGALVCVAVSLTVLAAQQTPVFRTAVDLVHLDVSVLDKNRHPVRGLTAADFTVLEDNKPQGIVAFTAVDVPDDPPEPPVWSTRAPADIQSNDGAQDPEGRLFVLLLDDAMLPQDSMALATARDVGKKFIERITPADRVAVVFSATGRNQDFTNDRGRLVKAIDSLVSGHATHTLGWETARDPEENIPCAIDPPGPKFDTDAAFRTSSISTLRMVAETLISAPQRRKALIYVSPGVEVDALSVAIPSQNSLCRRVSLKEQHDGLLKGMPELFLRMRRANVTIYPVDPMGNGGFAAYMAGASASIPLLRRRNQPLPPDFDWLNPGLYAPQPEDLARHVGSLSMDFLQMTAANTGGTAIVNTNDFDEGLDRIFRENSSYYLIGYQQPLGSRPGSMHSLKVTVNRPDVTVRTRSGYDTPELPKPTKSGKAAAPVTPLDRAIAGAVPDGSFPMRVALAPFIVPGQKNPWVTVVLGLAQPAVKARTKYTVDLQTNAYTIEGKPVLVGQRHLADVVLVPNGDADGARYDLFSSIMLAPGRYQLRISAHRALDGVSGSVYADIDVPDFTKPLAASGLVIEAAPMGAAAPIDAFDRFLPVLPTSNRDFRKGQDVTAFMRIYQGGKDAPQPVDVKTRIVNESDAPAGEGKDTLPGSQFHVGGRAADFRFAVPVRELPPGRYLLTFELSLKGGEPITRSLQFRVVQ